MKEGIINSYENIYENKMYSYNVDFVTKRLTVYTGYDTKKEYTTILFDGLLAHHFENIVEENIILSLQVISIDYFTSYYNYFLENSFKYAFPKPNIKNIKELKDFLTKGKYQVFEIVSSVGLQGLIIAKEITIKKNYALAN